jgi:putative acetyltransferase
LSAGRADPVFARADPLACDIAALVDAHLARSRGLYPDTSCHAYGPSEMEAEGVLLYAARISGRAVAIGGLKPLGRTSGEIKSMYTAEGWRGRGIARRLVQHLASEARALGWRALCLETGSDAGSAPARALYAGLGFEPCPPFGDHGPDPLSVFMTRAL